MPNAPTRTNDSGSLHIAKGFVLMLLAAVVFYGFSGFSADRARTRIVEEAQMADPTVRSAVIEGDDLVLLSPACSDEWLSEQRAGLARLAREADIEEIRCRRR